MIEILIAVVVVVGVLAAADLLLSFAVIRRLAALQSRMRAGYGGDGSPAVGYRVEDFRVRLLAGGDFTRSDLEDTRAVVVLLMATCEPCHKVIEELRALSVPLSWPLYVLITGTGTDVAAQMPPGAHVAEIPAGDPVIGAFGADGFPTVLALEDGLVRGSGLSLDCVLEHAGR